jgi:hypothetical protein
VKSCAEIGKPSAHGNTKRSTQNLHRPLRPCDYLRETKQQHPPTTEDRSGPAAAYNTKVSTRCSIAWSCSTKRIHVRYAVMHQNTSSRYMCACCAWIGTSHVNDHVRRRRLNGQAGTTSSSITPDGTTTSSCMTKLNITTTGEKRYQRHSHASRCGTLLSRLLQQGTVSELRREKGHLQVRHHRRHVCCPDITHTLSPRSTT